MLSVLWILLLAVINTVFFGMIVDAFWKPSNDGLIILAVAIFGLSTIGFALLTALPQDLKPGANQ